MNDALSAEEFAFLDDLLLETEGLEQSMDVSMLDGFVTALACAPETLPPSEWVRWVWDCEQGASTPLFESEALGHEVFDLILRHWLSVTECLETSPRAYRPVLIEGTLESSGPAAPADPRVSATRQAGHEPALFIDAWCRGFLLAMSLEQAGWNTLRQREPDWFALIEGHGMAAADDQAAAPALPAGDYAAQAAALAGTVRRIHRAFASARAHQRFDFPAAPARRVIGDDGSVADGGADAGTAPHAGAGDTAAQAAGGTIGEDNRPAAAAHPAAPKPGRNDPCPCGSGRKYKQCHEDEELP